MKATAKRCRWQEVGPDGVIGCVFEGLLVSTGNEDRDVLVTDTPHGWTPRPVGDRAKVKIDVVSDKEILLPDYVLISLRCFAGTYQSFQGGTGMNLSVAYLAAAQA